MHGMLTPMKAARIHRFGPPETIVVEEVARPSPGDGEVLVRVAAAGVGNWDALIREHKSVTNNPLPLTLGSDLSGIVESVGCDVAQFKPGDKVYGVTNPRFIGAYAEFALASAGMIALKPESLTFVEAASAPVVAVTAWQMLFEYGRAAAGQSVLVLGAAGNVGAYAVQLASHAGLRVFATAGSDAVPYVQQLGATSVIDYKSTGFEDVVPPVDLVLDTVGGSTRDRSFGVVKPGGVVVSVVSCPKPEPDQTGPVSYVCFLVEVTTGRLNKIGELFDSGKLATNVGTILPLGEVRRAHAMLGGAPHVSGKIVLTMGEQR